MKLILLFLLIFPFIVQAESTLIYEAQKKGIKLTEKDQQILENGELSTARYVTGGILGTYPIGLGVGHAIQGRWSEKGWIFTSGELGSAAIAVIGLAGCVNNAYKRDNCSDLEAALIVTGVIGFIGFRIWEIVDVWAVPPSNNQKYRELKDYINKAPDLKTKASLDLIPLINPKLGQGIALNFKF